MPILDVRVGVRKSAELTKAISEMLLETTTRVLHKKRELTAIVIDYVDPDNWIVGGTLGTVGAKARRRPSPPLRAARRTLSSMFLGGSSDQVATVTGILDIATHRKTASTNNFNESLGLPRVVMLIAVAHQDIGPLNVPRVPRCSDLRPRSAHPSQLLRRAWPGSGHHQRQLSPTGE
jgi:phenylpyruvate tautomerase PptA (4-oxalocrotonate tautomerase family)